MKKIKLTILAFIMAFSFNPNQLSASNVKSENFNSTPKTAEKNSSEILISRLHEINKMDKSRLTKSEKSSLRNEVISISEKLKADGGGIYISLGAIIIILILLIILL